MSTPCEDFKARAIAAVQENALHALALKQKSSIVQLDYGYNSILSLIKEEAKNGESCLFVGYDELFASEIYFPPQCQQKLIERLRHLGYIVHPIPSSDEYSGGISIAWDRDGAECLNSLARQDAFFGSWMFPTVMIALIILAMMFYVNEKRVDLKTPITTPSLKHDRYTF